MSSVAATSADFNIVHTLPSDTLFAKDAAVANEQTVPVWLLDDEGIVFVQEKLLCPYDSTSLSVDSGKLVRELLEMSQRDRRNWLEAQRREQCQLSRQEFDTLYARFRSKNIRSAASLGSLLVTGGSRSTEFVSSHLASDTVHEDSLKNVLSLGDFDLFDLFQHVRQSGFLADARTDGFWSCIANHFGAKDASAVRKAYDHFLLDFERAYKNNSLSLQSASLQASKYLETLFEDTASAAEAGTSSTADDELVTFKTLSEKHGYSMFKNNAATCKSAADFLKLLPKPEHVSFSGSLLKPALSAEVRMARSRSANKPPIPPSSLDVLISVNHAAVADDEILDTKIDFAKINLDNYEEFRQKLDRIEAKLARRPLVYYHPEFGFGVDYSVNPEETDWSDIRNINRLSRKRRRGGDLTRSGALDKRKRGTGPRLNSTSTCGGGRRRRRDSRMDEYVYDSDASENLLSDWEMDFQQSDTYSSRYCHELEPPEITVQKEEEIEMSLNACITDHVRPLLLQADNPLKLSYEDLQLLIDVQVAQMRVLKNKYVDLRHGMKQVRREMIDLKRLKKRELQQLSTAESSTLPTAQQSTILAEDPSTVTGGGDGNPMFCAPNLSRQPVDSLAIGTLMMDKSGIASQSQVSLSSLEDA